MMQTHLRTFSFKTVSQSAEKMYRVVAGALEALVLAEGGQRPFLQSPFFKSSDSWPPALSEGYGCFGGGGLLGGAAL